MALRWASLASCLVGMSMTSCLLSDFVRDSDTGREHEACLDFADALAKAAQRCRASSYQVSYDKYARELCGTAVGIRDETSLRAECIPSLGELECSRVLAGDLDGSCRSQIQRL